MDTITMREGREFRLITIPDDPRLSAKATRRRNVVNSKAWKRQRFTPRSMTKNHQHHLITL
jgi:hypothetical protein